jgi:hypothetical protein
MFDRPNDKVTGFIGYRWTAKPYSLRTTYFQLTELSLADGSAGG